MWPRNLLKTAANTPVAQKYSMHHKYYCHFKVLFRAFWLCHNQKDTNKFVCSHKVNIASMRWSIIEYQTRDGRVPSSSPVITSTFSGVRACFGASFSALNFGATFPLTLRVARTLVVQIACAVSLTTSVGFLFRIIFSAWAAVITTPFARWYCK